MIVASLISLFARNRAKTLVLGALTLALAGLVVKAIASNKPRSAAAAFGVGSVSALTETSPDPKTQAEMDERLRQSRLLWQVLREEHGIPSEYTFTFDPTYYTRDPSRAPTNAALQPKMDLPPDKPEYKNSNDQTQALHVACLHEQAAGLHLQSTVMAETPLAVINGEIVRSGERLLGFRVISIRPREIIVEKEGLNLTLELGKN